MEETKHPLQSKTIWTAGLQVLASVLVATGVLTADQEGIITSMGPEIVVGGVGTILAFISAWGRLTAKTALSSKKQGAGI